MMWINIIILLIKFVLLLMTLIIALLFNYSHMNISINADNLSSFVRTDLLFALVLIFDLILLLQFAM